MAVKQDQPLELISSKYYSGYSENEFIGPAGSFQYAENLNIRDDISGIQLSSLPETRSNFPSHQTRIRCYCIINDGGVPTLVSFYESDNNTNAVTTRINSDRPNETSQMSTLGTSIRAAVRFWDLVAGVRTQSIFAFAQNEIWVIDPIAWTASIVNPSGNIDNVAQTWSATPGRITSLVYSNSIILAANGNTLWRYVPVASAELPAGWSIIRKYKSQDQIIGLNIEGNYLKVTLDDGNINTKVYYLSGTFDVEDGGVVESIDWDNMFGFNCTSIDSTNYHMMKTGFDSNVLYLYTLNGYDKVQLFRTKFANGQSNELEYFTVQSAGYDFPFAVKRGITYIPTADGLWTFGKNKFGNLIMNKDWAINTANTSARCWSILGDYLYVSYSVAGGSPDEIEVRYYLEYRNQGYTDQDGILIDRILTGGVVGSWKENIQMNIGYELDKYSVDPGSIDVYIRPNRTNKTVSQGWLFVANITDPTSMVQEIYLDTSNFRADWNCIEYKLVLHRGADELVSPFVYDVSLFYNPNVERGTGITYSP